MDLDHEITTSKLIWVQVISTYLCKNPTHAPEMRPSSNQTESKPNPTGLNPIQNGLLCSAYNPNKLVDMNKDALEWRSIFEDHHKQASYD